MSELVAMPQAITSEPDLLPILADWLHLDVANGDACADTLQTYRRQIEMWLIWCCKRRIPVGRATADDVKAWRQELVSAGTKPSTISLKLTTVRRFYQSGVDRGYIASNPAANVRAPRERRALKEQIKYLSAGEAELLFRAVPSDRRLKPHSSAPANGPSVLDPGPGSVRVCVNP